MKQGEAYSIYINLSLIHYLNHLDIYIVVQITDSTQIDMSFPASPFELIDATLPHVWFGLVRVDTYSKPRLYLNIHKLQVLEHSANQPDLPSRILLQFVCS